MKDNIESFVSKFKSGKMSRRQLVVHMTALLATVAGGARAAYPGQGKDSKQNVKAMTTAEERKPFEEIARRKGVKISFEAPVLASAEHAASAAKNASRNGEYIHLDMDMVEESLRNAIKRTGAAGQSSIQTKLKHLLQKGTDAEKVEFVLGSGTYYFPGDVDRLAKISRQAGGKSLASGGCRRVCTPVYYLICRCIQLRNDQECRETSREFCEIYCG